MCGIVAAAARRDVTGTLIAGLKALEYRGYDSAGVALLTERGLERVRTRGKVLVAGGYNTSGVVGTAEVYGALGDDIFKNGFD